MIRLCVVVLVASTVPVVSAVQDTQIAAIRVHGNHSVADEEIIGIAGIGVGAPLTEATPMAVEQRLLASGRFADVDVRVRFRSLDATGDAVVVIVVRERTSFDKRWMLGPLFDVSDEYGLTFGAQLALVDFPANHFRIRVPASWGGSRSAGIEGVVPVHRSADGWNSRLELGVRRVRTIHPHFELADNRLELEASFASRFKTLVFTGSAKRSTIDFDRLDNGLVDLGAQVVMDTRRDRTIPGNAVYLQAGLNRLFLDGQTGLANVNRLHVEGRGYTRVVGQSLLAAQLAYTTASGPLPPYARDILGGGRTLRGHVAGRFIGDQLALASLELRLPLSSTLSRGRAGIHFFFDTGSAFDSQTPLRRAQFHHGAGLGAFFRFAFVGARIDLGFDLEGSARLHFGTQFKF